MSGHVDQEALDAWNRARERGAKRKMKPVWMQSGPIVEGRPRWFSFEFEPIGRAPKASTERRSSRRGALQGNLL